MENTVLEEIDKRIKRLEAEIEIVEERLRHLENLRKGYSPVTENREFTNYLLLTVIWALTGIVALIVIKDRIPYGQNMPLPLYVTVTLILLIIPLIYGHLSKPQSQNPIEELEERERKAKTVISLFYKPLRKAVEKNDREAIKAIADKILEDPLLAEAIEDTREGDPKIIAYALYLYSMYSPEFQSEVDGIIEKLSNKPVRALLTTLKDAHESQ